MPKLYLTHASVDAIPLSDAGTIWHYDTQTPGFCLAVGSRKKTFYIGKSLNGKNIRVRLGEFPAVKVAKARKDAEGMVGDISRGLDPRAQRREAAEKAKRERTVEQVMEAYIAENTRPGSVKMSQATARAYRDTFRLYAKGLLRRKISSVTHEEVVALHDKLAPIVIDEHGNETRPHFVYVANNTARTIRTLQRYAGIALPDFSFFDENSRVNGIKPDGRRDFGRAIARVPCPSRRAAWLLGCLTGIRRTALLSLRWADVDLDAGTIFLARMKNGLERRLPLATQSIAVIRSMRGLNAEWVFPSFAGSTSGHLVEPRDEAIPAGIMFHDTRRLFSECAHELLLPDYCIGYLRGDKLSKTMGQSYVSHLEMREPAERIGKRVEEVLFGTDGLPLARLEVPERKRYMKRWRRPEQDAA